jgi:solute carrier family 27 fatty acid transporter 1/4
MLFLCIFLLVNIDNKIGAVGYLPRCLPQSLFPVGLIKVDPNTKVPIRDKRGLCIRCDVGKSVIRALYF